mgnify:CR=1 FL=1
MGTANANNVLIKDVINTSMLDITSLMPLHSSHNFITRIKNANEIEFVFENINLPFDDANNDGYIAFKIKTLETLVIGDIFENKAEIYFDYNFPIITNTASTEIVAPLSIGEQNFKTIKLHPNQTNSKLNIRSSQIIEKLKVIDINGRVLKSITISNSEYSLDVSNLSNGIYFIELQSGTLKQTQKFIKN